MTIFFEIIVALLLSYILIQGYRALSRDKTAGREAIATDLLLGIGAVAVTVMWAVVLSTALVV